MKRRRQFVLRIALWFLLGLAACQESGPSVTRSDAIGEEGGTGSVVVDVVGETGRLSTPTTTPRSIAPNNTPLPPTLTATPTLIPTPTALPISIFGDPYAHRFSGIFSGFGAPCGVVDWLDFPIEPPDASTVSFGGRDYGVYRGRYEKFHAGEDWSAPRGRTNLGEPVYAIGHGFVTYAQPLGWGRDKGVVIIQHTFNDGSQALSFYGHLDEDSFLVSPGDCLVRGQQIAQIGRPRTPPHLHFEIRTHLPYTPGPGYWPTDPTEQGWLPPSQFIWNNRLSTLPGVIWSTLSSARDSVEIGITEGGWLLALEDGKLVPRSAANGIALPSLFPDDELLAAMLDDEGGLLYTVNVDRQLSQYAIDPQGNLIDSIPRWTVELERRSTIQLLPSLAGGIIVVIGDSAIHYNNDGSKLWQQDEVGRPLYWLEYNEQLIVSTTGQFAGLWAFDAIAATQLDDSLVGKLAVQDESLLIYGEEGLFRIDSSAVEMEPIRELYDSYLRFSDIATLEDGTILVAHSDIADRRLIHLTANGGLIWERSFSDIVRGAIDIIETDQGVYLVASYSRDGSERLGVFEINVAQREVILIAESSSRASITSATWYLESDGIFYANLGGGSLMALDLQAASTQVRSTDFRFVETRIPNEDE